VESCAKAKALAKRPTYRPISSAGMPGIEATISGRYGPMELSAVCSARERKASSRSWRMGSGVWSSADEEVDEASDSTAKRSLSVSEEDPGGLGGGVGKVWYRGIEGRRIAVRPGMGAPAWNEPEDLENRDRGLLLTPGPGRALLMEGRVMMSSQCSAFEAGGVFFAVFRYQLYLYSFKCALLLRLADRWCIIHGSSFLGSGWFVRLRACEPEPERQSAATRSCWRNRGKGEDSRERRRN
jgi:hypothetical protein